MLFWLTTIWLGLDAVAVSGRRFLDLRAGAALSAAGITGGSGGLDSRPTDHHRPGTRHHRLPASSKITMLSALLGGLSLHQPLASMCPDLNRASAGTAQKWVIGANRLPKQATTGAPMTHGVPVNRHNRVASQYEVQVSPGEKGKAKRPGRAQQRRHALATGSGPHRLSTPRGFNIRGMSVTASKTAEPPPAPSVSPPAAPRETDPVEYPERHWAAQSVWHGDAVRQATNALRNWFRDREDVLVAMELVVYYLRGDNTAWLQPDLQVVFGVARDGDRSVYKVWDEGKAPDFVLEVASPSTAAHDARHKAREYARIGVREYWRLDPKGSLMEAPLEGWVASRGRFDPVEPIGCTDRGGYLRSQVLGLDLRSRKRDGATVLVLRDPGTGEEFDGALEAAERRRRLAEKRAQEEARLRRAAEKEAIAAKKQAIAAEEQAIAAEERARALEERLQTLAAGSPRQRDA